MAWEQKTERKCSHGRGRIGEERGGRSESKKREQSQKEKGAGIVEGKTWQKKVDVEWRGNVQALTSSAMCTKRMRHKKKLTSGESSVEKPHDLPPSAIEVGVGIMLFDLLGSPPGGRGERDMITCAFGHARVENTDHITQAIDDEGA